MREVEIVFLIFRSIDIADCYLTFRGNKGMMVIVNIVGNVWPMLAIAMMAFCASWVSISAVYWDGNGLVYCWCLNR